VNGIGALLEAVAKRRPHCAALTWGEQDMSYGELDAAVEQLAERLAPILSPGQRVAVVAPNVPALVVGLFATWRIGGVAVPINARSREYELRRVLGDAAVSAVVSLNAWRGYSFADTLLRLMPELPVLRRCLFVVANGTFEYERDNNAAQPAHPSQPLPGSQVALILYTSGSTGLPKGALISHQSEIAGAFALRDVLGAASEDVNVLVVSLCHAFGLTCFLAALASGARTVLVESTFSLEPLVEAVRRHAATVLHGSPSLWVSVLKSSSGPLSTLRAGFVAGASCPASVLEALDKNGLPILNLYGMTELGAATSCRAQDPPWVRYATVGRALPGYDVRVAQDEVQVAGPFVTSGYFNRPELTEAAFDGPWFRTGDLGSLDTEGNLAITGRAKDVIHVAGHSVFPAEVEGFLLTHPDVAQAVVVGAPHATLGEAVQAFVVPRHGSNLTSAILLQFARARIAGYKLPYAIFLVDELPLLAGGKPDRLALVQSVAEVDI
jgi:acyl-CoA synthetase (AMP-forming)/AMP-acid ligase II